MNEIENLLKEPESTLLDWKSDFPAGLIEGKKHPEYEKGKGTLLKDLVSIANSDDVNDGYLIYGVKDEKTQRKVQGINANFKLDDADFQTWVQNYFNPPFKFHYSELPYDGKRIGIFEISHNADYPHIAKESIGGVIHNGQVWFRTGTSNTVAQYEDLKRMFTNEPFKIQRSDSPYLEGIMHNYKDMGSESSLLRLYDKDELLAKGYLIAYHPKYQRREIWVGYHNGEYELILMLKPKVD